MSERTRGLYLEEFEVGHTYVSRERVITQADVDAFADVSGDHNPLHTDPVYGATTIFGECVARVLKPSTSGSLKTTQRSWVSTAPESSIIFT